MARRWAVREPPLHRSWEIRNVSDGVLLLVAGTRVYVLGYAMVVGVEPGQGGRPRRATQRGGHERVVEERPSRGKEPQVVAELEVVFLGQIVVTTSTTFGGSAASARDLIRPRTTMEMTAPVRSTAVPVDASSRTISACAFLQYGVRGCLVCSYPNARNERTVTN